MEEEIVRKKAKLAEIVASEDFILNLPGKLTKLEKVVGKTKKRVDGIDQQLDIYKEDLSQFQSDITAIGDRVAGTEKNMAVVQQEMLWIN